MAAAKKCRAGRALVVSLSAFWFCAGAWLVKDPLSLYTLAGVLLVMGGLLLSKLNRKKNDVVFDG